MKMHGYCTMFCGPQRTIRWPLRAYTPVSHGQRRPDWMMKVQHLLASVQSRHPSLFRKPGPSLPLVRTQSSHHVVRHHRYHHWHDVQNDSHPSLSGHPMLPPRLTLCPHLP